jgi:hypothetical protein
VDQHHRDQQCIDGEYFMTCRCYSNGADDVVLLWQSLADRAKGRADLLKDDAAKEQRIVNIE